MKVRLFGQYLVERQLISREQLASAVARQRQENLRIGELAVELGLLSHDQALHINQLQIRTNKRFGDLASEQGLLSSDQLADLLERQQHEHRYIGEMFVAEGLITKEQLIQELSNHRALYQQVLEQLEQHIGVDPLGYLLDLAITLSKNMLLRTVKSNSNVSGVIGGFTDVSLAPDNCVQIYVSGDLSFTLALATDDQTMVDIASRFIDMDRDDCDLELAKDAFGELLNILLGQMLTELVVEGITYNHSTPDHLHSLKSLFTEGRSTLAVEMSSELGQFLLLVTKNVN